MLSCWHDLLFLFSLLFYLLPSMGWLCGVGFFGLIVSLPALHNGLQIIIIIIITIILFGTMYQSFMKIVPVVFELCAKVCVVVVSPEWGIPL